MDKIWQDLSYGARRLAGSPGFTAAAVLSLALGIGANSAIFSLVNAVLLQPVPVGEPERVVRVFGTDEIAAASTGLDFHSVSFPNYEDLRDQVEALSGVAAYAWLPFALTGGGEAEQVFGHMVTGNYFEVLGVDAAVGRTFRPEEDAALGAHPVVVLGHGLWERRFGSDRDLVGRTVQLNGQAFTVVGIAPKGFRGPATVGTPDLWVPMAMREQIFPMNQQFEQRRWRLFEIVARLAPGVQIEQAQAAVRTIGERLEREYPEDNPGRGFVLLPLTQSGVSPNQRDTYALVGLLLTANAGLVLLIACASVANLLLAQMTRRRREVAIRVSQGATRGMLIRQLLAESLLLSLMAGALGLLIAVLGRKLLWSLRPPFLLENAIDLSLNLRTLGFTLVIAVLAGVLFGIAPAFQASRLEVASSLKGQTEQTRQQRRLSLRNLLVVAQVAVSLVTLIGAGLFLRSFQNSLRVDTGFRTEGLLVLRVDLGAQRLTETQGRELQREVLEGLESLPGIASVTLAHGRPMVPRVMRSINVEGRENPEGGFPILINGVGLRYFRTLGIPLREGRDFSADDGPDSRPVAIVNETMANKLWPDGRAVGSRFRFPGEPEPVDVVGVVADSKYVTIGEEVQPFIYLPLAQRYLQQVDILVRARIPVASAIEVVRRRIREIHPNLPLFSVEPITDTIARSMWGARMIAVLLAIFGLLALVLSTLGLYSVLAYTVHQRRGEIGIRMALGARRGDLFKLVLIQAATFVAVGLALGVAVAFAASRMAEKLLFGISSTDLATYAGVSLVLVAVALLASLVPASRAARTEPLVALREG